MTAAFYLIGNGLSIKTLKAVGTRPLVQAVVLWAVVATGSLELIRAGCIHL